VREFGEEDSPQRFHLRLVQQLALAYDNEIGLLKLLLINIDDLRGETRPLLKAENAESANRIHQNANGGDREIFAIKPAERIGDGRNQVGATANRFRDKNLGPRLLS